MFTWCWLADVCAAEAIAFVLGHALAMKAIHGGKAKNDKLDSFKIATLLRGGLLPQAHVYPAAMRSTRDLLRRRLHLLRKRGQRLAHIQNIRAQYNLPEFGRRLAYPANRDGVADHFTDASVRKSIDVDLALLEQHDALITDLARTLVRTAKQHDGDAFHRLRSVPGTSKVLALTILYEIDSRFNADRSAHAILNSGRFVLDDETTDLVEFSWAEPMIPRQFDRRQPELGMLTVPANVNVQGLMAVETVEEEPVRPWNTSDCRHSARLQRQTISGSAESAKSVGAPGSGRVLCRVVRAFDVVPADRIGGEPLSRTGHAHCYGVGRSVASTVLIVLVSFNLKSPCPSLVAATAVVLCKALIPIEEVAVRVRCQFDVAPAARDPHQHVRRHEADARGRDRLVVVVLRLHTPVRLDRMTSATGGPPVVSRVSLTARAARCMVRSAVFPEVSHGEVYTALRRVGCAQGFDCGRACGRGPGRSAGVRRRDWHTPGRRR
jgi:Transposase